MRASVEPTRAAVSPGKTVEFVVTIFNAGDTVSDYEASFVGAEAFQTSFRPDRLSLLPNTTGDLRGRLTLPPDARIPAGELIVGIRVQSQTDASVAWVEEVRLDVAVVQMAALAIEPELVRAGRRARLVARIENKGNRSTDFEMRATDTEGVVRFDFAPRRIVVPAFDSASVNVAASAPQVWVGRSLRRQLSISAEPGQGGATLRGSAVWLQKPLLGPTAVAVFSLALLIVAAVAWRSIASTGTTTAPPVAETTSTTTATVTTSTTTAAPTTSTPPETTAAPTTSTTTQAPTTVPDFTGTGLDEAKTILDGFGLLVQTVERTTELSAPNQVVDQDPAPGSETQPGSVVRLTIARAPTIVASNESIGVDADFEEGTGFDLDRGMEVSDAREDLHLAFGIEALRGRFSTDSPTFDECRELLQEPREDLLWGTTRWACVLTDENRYSAVRFIDVDRISTTPIVARYFIQFRTWERE